MAIQKIRRRQSIYRKLQSHPSDYSDIKSKKTYNTRQYKAIQSKTSQSKAIQGNTRQYKAKRVKARQYKAIQGNTRQYKAKRVKARQYKAIQGNTRQYKAIQSKTSQSKAIQGNTRQWGDILPVIIVIFKGSHQFL